MYVLLISIICWFDQYQHRSYLKKKAHHVTWIPSLSDSIETQWVSGWRIERQMKFKKKLFSTKTRNKQRHMNKNTHTLIYTLDWRNYIHNKRLPPLIILFKKTKSRYEKRQCTNSKTKGNNQFRSVPLTIFVVVIIIVVYVCVFVMFCLSVFVVICSLSWSSSYFFHSLVLTRALSCSYALVQCAIHSISLSISFSFQHFFKQHTLIPWLAFFNSSYFFQML